jgi:hypothetical protein
MRRTTTFVSAEQSEDFLSRLRAINEHAEAMRDDLIDLMPNAPKDETEWRAMMANPETLKELGALFMLLPKNASWVPSIATFILMAISEKATAEEMAAAQESFLAGQVRVEMSCTCGQCPACATRKELGDEKAAESIAAGLRPKSEKPARRLIIPN